MKNILHYGIRAASLRILAAAHILTSNTFFSWILIGYHQLLFSYYDPILLIPVIIVSRYDLANPLHFIFWLPSSKVQCGPPQQDINLGYAQTRTSFLSIREPSCRTIANFVSALDGNLVPSLDANFWLSSDTALSSNTKLKFALAWSSHRGPLEISLDAVWSLRLKACVLTQFLSMRHETCIRPSFETCALKFLLDGTLGTTSRPCIRCSFETRDLMILLNAALRPASITWDPRLTIMF